MSLRLKLIVVACLSVALLTGCNENASPEKVAAQIESALATAVAVPTATPEPTQMPTSTAVPLTPTSAVPAPDPTEGRDVFEAQGCGSCHSTSSRGRIAPGLSGVWDRAADTKPGLTAAEYIRESVRAPQAFQVPGYTRVNMPVFGESAISDEALADLVAYLKTL